MFFFEKKEPKNCCPWAYAQGDALMRQVVRGQAQKFFASFFQKRRPCLP
jgi:hypothetical protein